jgi:steroid delta-isomerase
MHRRKTIALLVVLVANLWGLSLAQADSLDETAIRLALTEWTEHFNARHADQVCHLFAPELRYDYRGFPERGFNELCELLQRSLADSSKTYTYSMNIKEVIVSGDLAIVRLVWTLKVNAAGSAKAAVAREPGLDIFRKQADGSWKIIRYIGYEE